jgi:hypothetical protein
VEVYLHTFFDLGIRWRGVVSFTPRPLYPQGKSPWYPLDRRLDGPRAVLDTQIKASSNKYKKTREIIFDLPHRGRHYSG